MEHIHKWIREFIKLNRYLALASSVAGLDSAKTIYSGSVKVIGKNKLEWINRYKISTKYEQRLVPLTSLNKSSVQKLLLIGTTTETLRLL